MTSPLHTCVWSAKTPKPISPKHKATSVNPKPFSLQSRNGPKRKVPQTFSTCCNQKLANGLVLSSEGRLGGGGNNASTQRGAAFHIDIPGMSV